MVTAACWTQGLDVAATCCDERIDFRLRSQCFDGIFSVNYCCDLGVQASEWFWHCDTCVDLLKVSKFGRGEWHKCKSNGHRVLAVKNKFGESVAAKVVCLPGVHMLKPEDGLAMMKHAIFHGLLVPDLDESEFLPPIPSHTYVALIVALIPLCLQMCLWCLCNGRSKIKKEEAGKHPTSKKRSPAGKVPAKEVRDPELTPKMDLRQRYCDEVALNESFHTLYDLIPDTDTPFITEFGIESRPPLTHALLREFIIGLSCRICHFGIGHRDRVCLLLPNGPEAAVAFLALSVRCVVAPLNIMLTKAEMCFFVEDLPARAIVVMKGLECEAGLVVAKEGHICSLELHPSVEAAGLFELHAHANWSEATGSYEFLQNSEDHWSYRDHLALVLHTSGTTKKPKIVPLSHTNLCVCAISIASTLHLSPIDITVNIMPLYHLHGLGCNLTASLVAGAQIVCMRTFMPGLAIECFGDAKPSWYSAVPSMHLAIANALLESGTHAAPHTLKFIRNCSAALLPSAACHLEKVHGASCKVLPTYGMTESLPIASNPRFGVRSLRSVGLAAGPALHVIDNHEQVVPDGVEGEVCVKGANVMKGYEYRSHMDEDANLEAFTESRWLRTGDRGYLDENGYLCLTGRSKEIINRGGEKISPLEVENILQQHAEVSDVICFAAPHSQLGECVGAAVVMRSPTKTLGLDDLRHFAEMSGQLSDKWWPECLVLLSRVPRGPTGKPLRINFADRFKLPPLSADDPEATTMWDARCENGQDLQAIPIGPVYAHGEASLPQQHWVEWDSLGVRRKRSAMHLNMDMVDLLRIIATLNTIVQHLNIKLFPGITYTFVFYPSLVRWSHLPNHFYILGSVVMLSQRHRTAFHGIDILWNRLSSTLPMFLFPYYLFNALLCPRIVSFDMDYPTPRLDDLLFRRDADAHQMMWAFQIEIRVALVVLVLQGVEFFWGARSFWACVVVLASWSFKEILVRQAYTYSFATYWLPMGLTTLVLTRSRYLQKHARAMIWTKRVLGIGVLICLFFFNDLLNFANLGQSRDCHDGLCYAAPPYGAGIFLSGLLFQSVATMLCISPRWPRRVGRILNKFAELSLPMVLLHRDGLHILSRCERAAYDQWVYCEIAEHVIFRDRYFLHRSFRHKAAYVLLAFVILNIASQLFVWFVQKPWLNLLQRISKSMSRALVVLYLLVFGWDAYQRGYYDAVTPGSFHGGPLCPGHWTCPFNRSL